MGSEQSTRQYSRPTFQPNPRQNEVDQEYRRAQTELREIYEQRRMQERYQETLHVIRPTQTTKPQVAVPSTNSPNEPSRAGTTHTFLNLQTNPSMVQKQVATPRTQSVISFHTVPTNQVSQTGSTYTSLNEQNNQVLVTQHKETTKKQTVQPGLSQPATTSSIHAQDTTGTRFTPSAPPRERSPSSNRRNRSRNDTQKSFIFISRNNTQNSDNMSCRTCNNKFGLKIYQCLNGHSSCSDCHSRNALCGSCRLKITDMRNIMLEDYISQLKIPCFNAAEGCCLTFKMIDMEMHLKQCIFQEIICPVNGTCGHCNWRGKISQLTDHFNDVHPLHTQGNVDTELIITNICFDSHTLYLITLGPYNFLFHLKVSELERKIYMAVQLLGTTVSASKWDYEIHVYNKREPRRKYQFSDICTPASMLTDDLFKESNCAILPLPYAMTFINDGVLYYKFFIKQNQETKPYFNKNRRGRGAFRGRHN